MKRREAIEGGVLGALVGDACGVWAEFRKPHQIPPYNQIEMAPPPGYDRAHKGTPVGTWSDDGAMTMCLMASLVKCNGYDATDVARRFVDWMREGYMAVDGRVFDIGNTTATALAHVNLAYPEASGLTDEKSCGNGSLMRVLPLALWHRGTDDELIEAAMSSSRITHAHPRVLACVAIYVMWARILLDRCDPAHVEDVEDAACNSAWDDAINRVAACVDEDVWAEVEAIEATREGREIRGSGYVVDSLLAAKHLVETSGTYEDVVRGAIALGHDTDTTACVAGGIAGIVHGRSGIPARWVAALRDRHVALGLARRLPE